MKKNFFVIGSLILLSILTTVGCMKKTNNNINSDQGKNIVQTFNYSTTNVDPEIYNAANAHNTYLENSYNSLAQQPISDFIVGVHLLKNNLVYFENYPEFAQAVDFANGCSTPQETKDKVDQNKMVFRSNAIFDDLYNFVEQLADNTSSSAEFSNAVADYYISHYSNCPQEYISTFKNACGVAMGSFQYWNSAYENWENITQNHVQNGAQPAAAKQTKKEKIRDFVLADMTGSIFGVPGAAIASGLVAWAWD